MNTHPVQMLDPVFDYLDSVIRDHGDTLFLVLTYVAIPILIWILCGGLRRKLLKGKPTPHVPPVIVIPIPVGRPTPPPEQFNPFSPHHEPPHCDHEDHHLD